MWENVGFWVVLVLFLGFRWEGLGMYKGVNIGVYWGESG